MEVESRIEQERNLICMLTCQFRLFSRPTSVQTIKDNVELGKSATEFIRSFTP
jgi:hypothetical protein